MRRMTHAEARAFLAEGTRTATLATIRADGRPHVVPVWFLLDGEDLVFNTGGATAKAAAIRRDDRVALCIDDERFPYSYVLVEGTAALSDDLPLVRDWAERIAARYVGLDEAAAYGERNGVPGELLVRVRMTRVVGEAGVAE